MPNAIEFLNSWSDALVKGRFRAIAKKVNKEVVGPETQRMVKQNFDAGGKPRFVRNTMLTKFTKKIKGFGIQPLVATGVLKNKAIDNPWIKATYNTVSLEIRYPTKRIKASARMLHDGGTITANRTMAMRSFFWAMYYLAGRKSKTAQIWKYAAISPRKKLKVNIPARPWTILTSTQKRKLQNLAIQAWEKELNRLEQELDKKSLIKRRA